MSTFDRNALLAAGAAGPVGDAYDFQVAGDRCLSLGDEATALVALDRAYGLAPHDAALASLRAGLLERFTIEEHGLIFRYVPAGTFLMGSTTGDPDERPVHPVCLDEYWIAEVPMTWTAYCALAGWAAPPDGRPNDRGDDWMHIYEANKIRRQYCESEAEPESYDRKPMVAAPWADAESLAARISNERVEYALPTEAEWEKAARGGLIGKRYPWGDEPPTPARCDFNHFGDWKLADPRSFAPNGYGLYGMSGGVWEWTSTSYDALAYRGAETPEVYLRVLRRRDISRENHPHQRVLRGGSWTDSAAATTVSFRHASIGAGWWEPWGDRPNPNVGFRLVRRVPAR